MKLPLKAVFHAGLFATGGYLGFTSQPATPKPQGSLAVSATQATEAMSKPTTAPLPGVRLYQKTAKDFNSLSLADFPSALKRALAYPIPAVRNQHLAWLFAAWARADRAAALAAMMELKSPQAQEAAAAAILRGWVTLNAADAWQWVASLPAEGGLQVKAVAALLAVAADSDPQRYAAWADALEDPLLRARALDTIATTWSQREARQALEWIRQLQPAALRAPLLQKHIWQSEQIPMLEKLDLAREWPDRPVRLHHTAYLLESWAKKDSKAAFHWLITQPLTPDLQLTCAMLGSALREQMSVVELQALARRLLEVPHRNAFIAGAVGIHPLGTGSDPDKGRALLPLLGPGYERLAVLVGIGEGLAKRQQAQAETWVRTLSLGADRDAGIAGLANALVAQNQHGAALDWLAQVSPELPELAEMFDRTFKDWCRIDPGRAHAWHNAGGRRKSK